VAVDILGDLLAVVTPADVSERAGVAEVAASVREATRKTAALAYVDQSQTGEQSEAVAAHAPPPEVVERDCVLPPWRWVEEQGFAWPVLFRRMVRDYVRLPETVASVISLPSACRCCVAWFRSLPAVHDTLWFFRPNPARTVRPLSQSAAQRTAHSPRRQPGLRLVRKR
jgi:hypothetical protein